MEEYILKKGPFNPEIFNERIKKIKKTKDKVSNKLNRHTWTILLFTLTILCIDILHSKNHGNHMNNKFYIVAISTIISATYTFLYRNFKLYKKLNKQYDEYYYLYEKNSIDIPLRKLSNYITKKGDSYIIPALTSIDDYLYYETYCADDTYKRTKTQICHVFRYRSDSEWRIDIGDGRTPKLNDDDYNFLMSL